MEDESQIRIGISACLLGQEVRFDGGHKRDPYVTHTLAAYFDWVPVCPEVELGLGTPRETIHLVQIGDKVRLKTTKTDVDLTERMQNYAQRRAARLCDEDLDGFILKKDSPSCGLQHVKVNQPTGRLNRKGRGLFAEALLQQLPNLPIEEEGRLCDPRLRENWVARVFAYHALKALWRGPWNISDLVNFHTRCKFLLSAHCGREYRELGRLVAAAESLARSELRSQYEARFMRTMKRVTTVNKNANVLHHIWGCFKKQLDGPSGAELLAHIEDYRRGSVPLVVPLTLIRHYVSTLDVDYLQDQFYLNPHPKQLALRNHA